MRPPLRNLPRIPDMTALSLQFMRSLPVSAAPLRGFRSGFRHLSLTETRVLVVTLAALLCILVCTSFEQHQSLDERAMLSAMLAAGGMPLVSLSPALCTAPNQHSRFDQSEMRTLFRS
jgi:hypothetical protein